MNPPVLKFSSIRFPLYRERRGSRHRGRRNPLIPVTDGLHGAAGCTARMLRLAISHRDSAADPHFARWRRNHLLHMRSCALWARVFAGHLQAEDIRLETIQRDLAALRQDMARLMGGAA